MTSPLLPAQFLRQFHRRDLNVMTAAEREYVNEKLATFKIVPS